MQSASFSDRQAALAALEAAATEARDARVRQLEALASDARAECDATVAKARAEHAAVSERLESELAAEARATLTAIAERWCKGGDTRALAKEFFDAWHALDRRAEDELGAYLDGSFCGYAFAAAQGMADRLHDDDSWSHSAPSTFPKASNDLRTCLVSVGSIPELARLMSNLEIAANDAWLKMRDADPAATAARFSAATTGGMLRARSKHRAAKAEAANAARAARAQAAPAPKAIEEDADFRAAVRRANMAARSAIGGGR